MTEKTQDTAEALAKVRAGLEALGDGGMRTPEDDAALAALATLEQALAEQRAREEKTRRERAEADNAALLTLLRNARPALRTSTVMAALEAYDACLAQPHPGAALLERLSKAEASLLVEREDSRPLRGQVITLKMERDKAREESMAARNASVDAQTRLEQVVEAARAMVDARWKHGATSGAALAALNRLDDALSATGEPQGWRECVREAVETVVGETEVDDMPVMHWRDFAKGAREVARRLGIPLGTEGEGAAKVPSLGVMCDCNGAPHAYSNGCPGTEGEGGR